MKVIAQIYNDFNEKFGIPRQSGLAPDVKSVIVFNAEFRSNEALRGIDNYSHLWLIWQFSKCSGRGWRPTVRPPRLGGNKRLGVFATRSPFRPNPIGLSSVRLDAVEKTKQFGTVLHVSGADLMNGTPIYDIKPYIAYTDSHEDAVCGFADKFAGYSLKVECSDELMSRVESEKRSALIEVLKNDPRPSYQNDENRVYAMSFGKYQVRFKVKDSCLTVADIR